jgi:hypothetical protein
MGPHRRSSDQPMGPLPHLKPWWSSQIPLKLKQYQPSDEKSVFSKRCKIMSPGLDGPHIHYSKDSSGPTRRHPNWKLWRSNPPKGVAPPIIGGLADPLVVQRPPILHPPPSRCFHAKKHTFSWSSPLIEGRFDLVDGIWSIWIHGPT